MVALAAAGAGLTLAAAWTVRTDRGGAEIPILLEGAAWYAAEAFSLFGIAGLAGIGMDGEGRRKRMRAAKWLAAIWLVPSVLEAAGCLAVPGFAGAKALAVAAGIRAAVLAYVAAVLLWFIPRLAAKARDRKGNAAGEGR